MARLLIHVEGQTEEDFVNEMLRAYLVANGYYSVGARIVGNARLRQRRGGIRPWSSVRTDIINHLKEDADCIATTMVDYYGLPQHGAEAWPGRANAANVTFVRKAECVEQALLEDVVAEIGEYPQRFVPFIVMHEFEGLLFSDCGAFSRAIGRPELEAAFTQIRDDFGSPEEINDSADTAPCKRIEALVPGYEKPLYGTLAALEIGLVGIRAQCPHFDAWLRQLEALVS
ncbi:MAG TPA: DUF4276 family protein [Bryobacteraceae bacterium]|nr:DUF4276 family protein [Bryobacteraceae bacterium]